MAKKKRTLGAERHTAPEQDTPGRQADADGPDAQSPAAESPDGAERASTRGGVFALFRRWGRAANDPQARTDPSAEGEQDAHKTPSDEADPEPDTAAGGEGATASTTDAQLVEQLSQLEELKLASPIALEEPRAQEIHELRRHQSRLGQELGQRAAAKTSEMSSEHLVEQLQGVAQQSTYADRILTQVYLGALVERHEEAETALRRWSTQSQGRRHQQWGRRRNLLDVYAQGAPNRVLSALGYQTVKIKAPATAEGYPEYVEASENAQGPQEAPDSRGGGMFGREGASDAPGDASAADAYAQGDQVGQDPGEGGPEPQGSEADSAEDVVDGEVLYDSEEAGAGRAGGWARRTAGKAKEGYERRRAEKANTPQGQRQAYDRARYEERRTTQEDAFHGDQRAQLQLNIRAAQQTFTDDLRKSRITAQKESKQTQRKKLSDLHDAYASMMVTQCLKPLQNGVNARNLLNTVSMGTAMWMLSPNFRTKVGEYGAQVRTAILDKLDRKPKRDAKIVRQGEKARQKEARLFDKTGQGREAMSQRDQTRLAKIERLERGDRELVTEHSAALTQIGLAQSAYDEMRRPGANPELVMQNYNSAVGQLYSFVDADGVDRKAVAKNMRVIVGQLIERDPDQAAVFSQLGHGWFTKTEPQEVFLEGGTEVRKAWTGDYVGALGENISGGSFTVRPPAEPDDHRQRVAQTMYAEAVNAKSPAEFSNVIEQYVLGQVTREHPAAGDQAEDPGVRTRLNKARAMFASMRGDGLSDQDQKLVYMGGFDECVQNLQEYHPERWQQWLENRGPHWKQRMHDLIDAYSQPGEHSTENQAGVRVWAEPQENEPEQERDSSPMPGGEGATRQPAAAPVPGLNAAPDFEREAECHKLGLVDEHGKVDERRVAEMESKGVSLERAAGAHGGWSMDETALSEADPKSKVSLLVKAISDHIADDVLRTLVNERVSNGNKHQGADRNAAHAVWPVVRVWRERSTALEGESFAGKAAAETPVPLMWLDEASKTRAREIEGMSASMGSLDSQEQDDVHSLAYVRALEKIVAHDPSCEQFVRELVAYENGRPDHWRQHEYEAALARGCSREHNGLGNYGHACEALELEPAELEYTGPDSGTAQKLKKQNKKPWHKQLNTLIPNAVWNKRSKPGPHLMPAGSGPDVSEPEQSSGPELGD